MGFRHLLWFLDFQLRACLSRVDDGHCELKAREQEKKGGGGGGGGGGLRKGQGEMKGEVIPTVCSPHCVSHTAFSQPGEAHCSYARI